MTIYDLLMRLQREVIAGNGHREFCTHGSCLNPVSVIIEPCKTEDNKLVIKFRNKEVVGMAKKCSFQEVYEKVRNGEIKITSLETDTWFINQHGMKIFGPEGSLTLGNPDKEVVNDG